MSAKTLAPPARPRVRENLKVCEVCGQIFDLDHASEVEHHKHADGREKPLPPDTRL
jgi:hypothetical protein